MRLALRKVVLILGFSLMLNLITDMVHSPHAEAAYHWNDALGTVGIATGIGSVIGFSTIAFYDEPFSHMSNMLIGAGVGALVGLGVAAYLSANDTDDEISPDELLPPQKTNNPKPDNNKQLNQKSQSGGASGSYDSPRLRRPAVSLAQNLGSTTLAQRGHPRGWSIAANVVELRF